MKTLDDLGDKDVIGFGEAVLGVVSGLSRPSAVAVLLTCIGAVIDDEPDAKQQDRLWWAVAKSSIDQVKP